jgi:hypothetical protein
VKKSLNNAFSAVQQYLSSNGGEIFIKDAYWITLLQQSFPE